MYHCLVELSVDGRSESEHASLIDEHTRRGSRILKWGVNFCNNVIEPKPGGGDKKRKEADSDKGEGGGGGGENSPISPPLDPHQHAH